LAATSSGPLVQVYDVASRKEIARINTGAPNSYVAMSAAGDGVIVSDGPNGARRFEVGK
jgi:hypothetical protein